MKITKREANLLSFLVLLSMVFVFVFLIIIPLQNSIDAKKQTKLTLEDQKALMVAQLANNNGLDTKLSQAEVLVNDELVKIETNVTSEEFELRLQPYLIQNNVNVISWVVNEPAVATPQLPTYQKIEYNYKLKELLDSYHQITNSDSPLPISETELLRTTISVTFNSSNDVYLGFLDTIAEWKSTVYVIAATRDSNSTTATVSIDLYTIYKP